MNKYRRLLSNTVLFALSTFSSKVLVFLLMPLYTRVLTTSDFGVVDLIMQAANLLIPVVSLGIMNAVVRFGLDRGYSKQGVFTAGAASIGVGFLVFAAAFPLVGKLPFLNDRALLLYAYVLCACLRSLFSQFVRAKMLTRLYAFDGLLSTIFTIAFNVLYLIVLKMGVTGYLLAIISADLASSAFLFFTAQLYRYFAPSALTGTLWGAMLRYSLPMIPATMFWWVTNVSDRYMVTYMVSEAANGLYAVAYKIPTIVTLFSTIFTEAWQLSAVQEGNGHGRNRFFTKIFLALQGIVFITGAGLIWCAKLAMRILASADFYGAWQFIPILILATVYSCFSSFLSSVYMVEKKSTLSLATTLVGAALNIALNLLLIPKIGVNGAAVATFASYFAVFLIRAVNTRRYIKIDISPFKMALNTAILVVEAALMLLEVHWWPLWCGAMVLCMIALNAGPLLAAFQKLLRDRA